MDIDVGVSVFYLLPPYKLPFFSNPTIQMKDMRAFKMVSVPFRGSLSQIEWDKGRNSGIDLFPSPFGDPLLKCLRQD